MAKDLAVLHQDYMEAPSSLFSPLLPPSDCSCNNQASPEGGEAGPLPVLTAMAYPGPRWTRDLPPSADLGLCAKEEEGERVQTLLRMLICCMQDEEAMGFEDCNPVSP